MAAESAAVADWRVADLATEKIKKQEGTDAPALVMVENPDILATLSTIGNKRPALVIGFAAETTDVIANAIAKRTRKGCDWIVANDVSPATGTFGGGDNTVHLIDAGGAESWPRMTKSAVATQLAARISNYFEAAQ